ncbi:MAG: hypothetical protein CSB19_00840 [Clostridiales bacterium]|nr:MAG: hypothetical protein CSB19_00840 [Clostridiales bacterium]
MKLNAKKMALIVLSMVGVAMFDNIKGVFLPGFVSEFNTSYRMMGTLFLACSLAYMAGSFLGGYGMSYFGKAKSMQFAAFLASVSLAIIAFYRTLSGLFIGFIGVGFATAVSAMVINTTIPNLDVKNHAWLMNFVHFLYGMGATLAVRFSGYLIARGWQYPMVYGITLAIFLAMFLLSFSVHLPEEENFKQRALPFTATEKKMAIVFGVALGFYVIAELQTGAWLVNFIVAQFSLSENKASTYMSLFFLVFSFGRLFGGLVAHRFGLLRTVSVSMLLAAGMYSYGLFAGASGLYVIAVSGAFFSICFPTTLLALKQYFPTKLNRASGFILSISVGINVLSNYLMGFLSDEFGVYKAMFLMPFSLLVGAAATIYIQYRFSAQASTDLVCDVDIDE